MPASFPPPARPSKAQNDLEDPAGVLPEEESTEWLERHLVTAVLVAHDGAQWLPTTLAALDGQRHRPDRVVAVDTGSTDESPQLLRAALGAGKVLPASADTGFGAAVAQAVGTLGPQRSLPGTVEWLWLLHDDSAPEPDCLVELLRRAEGSPSVAVVGAKARDWDDPRLLVEVGLTTDAAGRRETGLERREYDQGQHDDVDEVLAVGTAGMLVRRDVLEELGGFAPELPLFREDLDLGWRVNAAGHRVVVATAAVVRHARAVSTGRRRADAVTGRATALDRRHALEVVLAHAGPLAMVLTLPRLLLLSVVRAVGFVLIRRPRVALDELAAARDLMLHPGRLRALRSSRRAGRTVPQRETRHLLAPRTARLRRLADVLRDAFSGGQGQVQTVLAEPTGDSDDGVVLGGGGSAGSALLRLLRRPPVALVLGLTLIAVVAERRLIGTGQLYGGRLLPSPSGVSDLLGAYTSTWRTGSGGSGEPAAPFLAVLGLVGVPLLGKASLAVALVLLASVPLAGLTAYVALGRVTRTVPLRLWGAVTYALLPSLTGAVAAGRLGPAVAVVLLPLLLVSVHRVLVPAAAPTAGAAFGGRHAWAAGLLLSVVVAFAPGLYPLALVLLAVGVVVLLLRADPPAGTERPALGALVVAVVPALLLLPWSWHVLTEPSLLLLGIEPGTASSALAERALAPADLLLLNPGGLGTPAPWLLAGLLLAALAGLTHAEAVRARVALGAFAVAGVAWTAAVLVSRSTPTPPGGVPVVGWPGEHLAVAAAALVVAAVVFGDGLTDRLRGASFGWRQPAAAVVVLLALLGPLAAAGTWAVQGVDGPLTRRDPALLPAFAAAAMGPGDRVLHLRTDAEDGRLSYALTGSEGARLGDGGAVSRPEQREHLDRIVEALVAPGGGSVARDLATYAVRFVVVPLPVDRQLARALDAQGGLARQSFEGSTRLWEVAVPSPPVGVLPPLLASEAAMLDGPTGETLRQEQPLALDVAPTGGSTTVPTGPPGRLLVLAQARDDGWRASVDGTTLEPATAWGWAQAFVLPPGGGDLDVSRSDGGRSGLIALQLVILLAVLVLAAPPVRGNDLDGDLDPVVPLAPSDPAGGHVRTGPAPRSAP